MKIHFYLADQNPHRDRTRGITQYTRSLLAELSRRPDIDICYLASRSSYRPLNGGFRGRTLPFRTDHLVGRLLADQCHPFRLPRSDIYHYPKGHLSQLSRPRGPTVGTVHDAIILYYAERYPQTRSRAAFAYWQRQFLRSVARFDLILTVSEHAKRSIEEFCARRNVRCPPITVTYEGARWEDALPPQTPKQDYVIHLASDQPHKRTDTLLEFWRTLEEGGGIALPNLRLIGSIDAQQRKTLARLTHASLVPPQEPEQLRDQLLAARALILPSEVEGFGLPALESYYLHTPALYVRDTAVEEILGPGCPGGFDLSSVDSFRVALDEVLDLPAEAIHQRATELRHRFAWARCADRTVAAYHSLL
jgi:glycosyltransferase involved in cell wall biosynthesis